MTSDTSAMSTFTSDLLRTEGPAPGSMVSAMKLLDTMASLISTTGAVIHRQTDALGLNGAPLGILRKLEAGPARPSDLAWRLQLDPAVVHRAVVPLEKSGLVERLPDRDDPRGWRLGITPAGRNRLRQRQQLINSQFEQVLSDWNPADLEQLAELMHRLDESLATSSAPADAGKGGC